jgi:hypothetical protein
MFSVPFRSVLSMDVEYRGAMPNLKISTRNTIQATGCQNMEVLSEILYYLFTTYRGRGFNPIIDVGLDTPPRPIAFVGDIVLANVHFKLGRRIDRIRLRDAINRSTERRGFVASYEPLVRDVSVSIKHLEDEQLPNAGAVHPMWTYNDRCDRSPGSGWTTVRYQDLMRMVPNAVIKRRPRCHTFRVFATGSVVQVGRWPQSMIAAHASFRAHLAEFGRTIMDRCSASQTTLDQYFLPRGGVKRIAGGDWGNTEKEERPHHHATKRRHDDDDLVVSPGHSQLVSRPPHTSCE